MPSRGRHQKTIIIPSGSYTHLEPLDLRAMVPVSLRIPSAWTDAPVTFSGSTADLAFDTSDYSFLASSGAKPFKLFPVVVSGCYQLNPGWFEGINWLFICSGDLSLGVGSLVNQAADRIVVVTLQDRDVSPMVFN